MLTKTKKNRKISENVFFEKIKQKSVSVWPRGSNNHNLKEICAFSSEIIATRTTDDRRRTKVEYHDLC